MTVTVGWHGGGTVCLIADTAVTHPGDSSVEKTSFNETVAHIDGNIIEEGFIKLVPLGRNAAAALSGNAARGTTFLRGLTGSTSPYLEEALRDVAAAQRTERHESFGLLVGCVSDRGTGLVVFDSLRPSEVTEILPLDAGFTLAADGILTVQPVQPSSEHSEGMPTSPDAPLPQAEFAKILAERVVILGNVPDYLRDLIKLAVPRMIAAGIDAERVLVGCLALLQNQGKVFGPLLEQGIGGTINGLAIDQNGLRWQPDLTYVMFDSLEGAAGVADPNTLVAGEIPTTIQRVSSGVRNGIGYVFSSFRLNRLRVLPSFGSQWTPGDHDDSLVGTLRSGDTPFFIFAHNLEGNVIVVDRRSHLEKYVAIRSSQIRIIDTLENEMRLRPPPRGVAQLQLIDPLGNVFRSDLPPGSSHMRIRFMA